MDVVESALESAGVDQARVHLERFEIEASAAAEVPAVPEHVEAIIELDGRRVTSEYRSGLSLLQTARAAGLQTPSSCELGACGTCMARVVAGCAVMRHDAALTPEEVADGWVLTCQAVPTTPIIHVVYE